MLSFVFALFAAVSPMEPAAEKETGKKNEKMRMESQETALQAEDSIETEEIVFEEEAFDDFDLEDDSE